jgi:hypothetical protein
MSIAERRTDQLYWVDSSRPGTRRAAAQSLPRLACTSMTAFSGVRLSSRRQRTTGERRGPAIRSENGDRQERVGCASSRRGQADTGAASGIDWHRRSPNVGIRGCGVACTTLTGVRCTSRPAVAGVGSRARRRQELAESTSWQPTTERPLSLRIAAVGSTKLRQRWRRFRPNEA